MYIHDSSMDKIYPMSNHTATVTACNRCRVTDDWHTIREKGRNDWTLYYCEQGRIHFNDYCLCPGQIWICPANVKQDYYTYKKEHTVYRYVHFTGSDVDELLNSLGIIVLKPFNAHRRFDIGIFDKIYEERYHSSPLSQLKAEYYMIRLLCMLAADSQSNVKMLNCVTDDMQQNFSLPYDAGRYAAMLNVSVDRFNHIFKEIIGVPPMGYYNKLRINEAQFLLENTSLKIQEIALRIGYENPLYFSQVFKKATNQSPISYRKIHSVSSK